MIINYADFNHLKGIDMKKILLVLSIFVFAVFFCTGCKKTNNEITPTPEKAPEDTKIVSDKGSEKPAEDLLIRPTIGVGKIKIGMTVKQMENILGKPDIAATGISYMYRDLGIEIVAKDSVTINAIVCGNPSGRTMAIVKAQEKACKFKTIEGIGIGSTEEQVIKAFGQPTNRSNNKLGYKNKRMSIHLSNGKVIGMWIQ